MKILHTSDWHLGVSADRAPRHEEHGRFLEWLLQILREQQVDVLLIAGDVFHYTQPSAAAQAQFFGFLSECSRISGLDVVVIAGNHDSPSRLEAPGAVLRSLRVHVVGNLPEDRRDALVCIERGAERLVVAAVPYVSESRLGIVTMDRSATEVREAYAQAFSQVYEELADLAQQEYPGARLVAMGHLTCVGAAGGLAGDYATAIHQSWLTAGLGPEIFDPRYEYVALGHVHRPHRVDARVAYAGTPVATTVVEARSARKVWLVGEQIEALQVPVWRDIFELRGERQELLWQLQGLQWEADLAPYLHVVVDGEGEVEEFQEVLTARFGSEKPKIVSFQRAIAEVAEVVQVFDSLQAYSPAEVFEMFWRSRHGTEPDVGVRAAFEELLAEEFRED